MSTATAQIEMPEAAPPAPKRQLIVGTTLAAAAGTMLVGAMLAVWALLRERYLTDGLAGEVIDRFPVNYIIPEVASNVMLITVWTLCIFAQWAVYAGKRGDRTNTALALGVTFVFGLAYVNAQAFVYVDMGVELASEYYGALFYAMTGTMLALVVVGLIYTTVAALRALAGTLRDTEILSAHAIYWYFIAAAYSAVWFVVYVTK